MTEWISVEDRLPENDQPVLVVLAVDTVNYYPLSVRSYIDEKYGLNDWVDEYGYTFCDDEIVTHWQPLPEPPATAQKNSQATNQ